MTIPVFIVVAIIYAITGIGCAKVLAKLNENNRLWDGATNVTVCISWPIAMIVCSFWNFKND